MVSVDYTVSPIVNGMICFRYLVLCFGVLVAIFSFFLACFIEFWLAAMAGRVIEIPLRDTDDEVRFDIIMLTKLCTCRDWYML